MQLKIELKLQGVLHIFWLFGVNDGLGDWYTLDNGLSNEHDDC